MDVRVYEKEVLSSDEETPLKGVVYEPDGDPKGLFQVVHGMTEHIARYDKFMREIASHGYVVFGHDHLGHGKTAGDKEKLGYFKPKDGYDYLARDVYYFACEMKRQYGAPLPFTLMGHSMGSFVVRVAATRFFEPDSLIIMGTGGKNPASGLGLFMINLAKAFKGEKYRSEFIDKLIFGKYNDKFKSENDPRSWLTKDVSVRRAFDADEYCNFKFTLAAMKDLVTLNRIANSKSFYNELAKDTRVLMLSGKDDPVGNYGKGVTEVYNKIRRKGINVNMKLYENCRHEILNDDSYDDVVKDILEFIKVRR